jgi:aspartyl-tRNA synthetase
MAFIQQEDIMKVIEDLLSAVWKEALGHSMQTPLPRRTYRWCMDNYGSDKPDTRYELKLQDVTDIFANTGVSVLQNKHVTAEAWQGSFGVKAINVIGLSSACNDKEIESILNEAKLNSAGRGVVMIRVGKNGAFKSSISKYLSEQETQQLSARLGAREGDLIMLSAGLGDEPLQLLGKMRVWCSNILQQKKLLIIPADRYDFFWVVDFPLFTWEDGVMAATHHPFTAPVSEDAHMLLTHPEKVRGQHYDIVLNGIELGGGSIRIHRAEEQLQVFRDVLKLPISKVDEFSHLLEALSHGCPPHGGIALGLDRLVAQALGAKSLREVLAFPKTGTGAELLTGSPSTLSHTEMQELIDNLKTAQQQLKTPPQPTPGQESK